jgi:hypothetical protein
MTRQLRDVAVLTGRNLVHIAREPLQLSDVTVQPVLFTLLFVYVFGSGVVLPGGGSYTDFAIAGLLAMNLTTSAMGTAVGLSTDLGSGVIDRFRTLPMWRPSVLVGRSLADLMTAAICAAFVAATGLAIGWRPDAGAASIAGGFAIFLLFSYGLSWGCACLGSPARSSPPSTCRRCCARSPIGTRSAPSPQPHANCSATPTQRRASTRGRSSTRCSPRCCGRSRWSWSSRRWRARCTGDARPIEPRTFSCRRVTARSRRVRLVADRRAAARRPRVRGRSGRCANG